VWHVVLIPVLGGVFFAFHVWLYSAFLKPPASGKSKSERNQSKD
jgi:hypothetical protein